MKKGDFVLLFAVLGVAALLALTGLFREKKEEGASVRVFVDGTEVGTYALSTDRTIEIKGVRGTNVLRIENGVAFMEKASCPDFYCIQQGKISKTGEKIICLPNKIVVEVTGAAVSDLDAVVQ